MLTRDDIGIRIPVRCYRYGIEMAHIHIWRCCTHVYAAHGCIPEFTEPNIGFDRGIHVQIMTPLGQIWHEPELPVQTVQLPLHAPKVRTQFLRTPDHVVRPHHERRRHAFPVFLRIASSLAVCCLKPVFLRLQILKRCGTCPICPVKCLYRFVPFLKPGMITLNSLPVKARCNNWIPHGADRYTLLSFDPKPRTASAIGFKQPGNMLHLCHLCLFGPVFVPVSIRAVRFCNGFSKQRRAVPDIWIQIVSIQIKRQEHKCQSLPGCRVHHIFLLDNILAGQFTIKARFKISPRLAVQFHTVKTNSGD